MDILHKLGIASQAMAEVALAMEISGNKAEIAAMCYEDLTEECKQNGMNYEHYESIAALFRGIVEQNKDMDFKDLISMCLNVAEVCK